MSDQSQDKENNKKPRGWFARNIPKAIIILIAIAALTAVTKIPAKKREAPLTEAPPVNVTVMTVKSIPELPDTFDLPAVVEPNQIVMVSAEVAGRVELIAPEEGDPVKVGQLLIKLNEDLVRPEFESAKAQVDRDQIEYKRMADLVDIDATSKSDLDNATTQLAVSKAKLEEVRARLNRTRILAPATGILNDLLVEEGEYVQPGTPVAELVDTSYVKVVVEVPERDISFFTIGRTVEVIAENKGEKETLSGPITFISELADPQTRSTRIEIMLENRNKILRSGQIVHAIMTKQILKNAIMIPLLAVIPMEDCMAVYVVNSSEAQRRQVEIGIMKDDNVQIIEGLQAGDKLVIAGHRFVAPGQKVTIVSENN